MVNKKIACALSFSVLVLFQNCAPDSGGKIKFPSTQGDDTTSTTVTVTTTTLPSFVTTTTIRPTTTTTLPGATTTTSTSTSTTSTSTSTSTTSTTTTTLNNVNYAVGAELAANNCFGSSSQSCSTSIRYRLNGEVFAQVVVNNNMVRCTRSDQAQFTTATIAASATQGIIQLFAADGCNIEDRIQPMPFKTFVVTKSPGGIVVPPCLIQDGQVICTSSLQYKRITSGSSRIFLTVYNIEQNRETLVSCESNNGSTITVTIPWIQSIDLRFKIYHSSSCPTHSDNPNINYIGNHPKTQIGPETIGKGINLNFNYPGR